MVTLGYTSYILINRQLRTHYQQQETPFTNFFNQKTSITDSEGWKNTQRPAAQAACIRRCQIWWWQDTAPMPRNCPTGQI